MPGYFSLVMGLCGLALAWHRAAGALGEMARSFALALTVLALMVFAVLLVASLLRWWRYPGAFAEDCQHPVRHAFVAAPPVSLLLLAALGLQSEGALGVLMPLWSLLWVLGVLGLLWATLWVLGRWLAVPASVPGAAAATLWPSVTPVLLIAVVGNVVVPLAGLKLGHPFWSLAQFGIGALLWPVLLALIFARRIASGPLPDRLLPSWFITIAPPSVIGFVATQMQAPLPLVLSLWGVALFFLLWASALLRRVAGQPFGVAFWSLSFPLAAFTALTLRVAEITLVSAWQLAGLTMLAITSVIILWLCLATLRGLRNGSLLAPETLAPIVPAA